MVNTEGCSMVLEGIRRMRTEMYIKINIIWCVVDV